MLLAGCNTTKFVPEGEMLLDKVKVTSDNKEVSPMKVQDYVKLRTNSKLFSLFKTPLAIYSLASRDTSKWTSRVLQHLGEAPVLYDERLVVATRNDLTAAMQNMGYLHAETEVKKTVKDGCKLSIEYVMHPGNAYFIKHVAYDIADPDIAALIMEDSSSKPLIGEGVRLDVDILDAERKRITAMLLNRGYYRFNKEYITYTADTLKDSRMVNLTMNVALYQRNSGSEPTLHPVYRIGKVTYTTDVENMPIRQEVLEENTWLKTGDLFREKSLQDTYNSFSRLNTIKYTNITFSEVDNGQESTVNGDNKLDCNIGVETLPPNTISFQPEGTNTSGDFGAALSAKYENRNIFRGSEHLSVEGRFAYEHIRSLVGYADHDFLEYSLEATLMFPRLIAPFIKPEVKRNLKTTTSELIVSYDLQNRPEFHRRVLSGGWHYRWKGRQQPSGNSIAYKFDLLDLDFVSMPWISETFRKEYLEDEKTKNAILKYNYEDLFIMNMAFGVSYTDGVNAYKASIETAGNLMDAVSEICDVKNNEYGQRMPFGIAYAQYVKGDFDYARSMKLSPNITLVLHGGLGIAYPYGNSTILPFEKRYFSGGANSVRGWTVRGLGPGKYVSDDGKINFINQTGDMKLDLNAELRTYLFWKFNAAFFLDAGNIWTLRDNKDQPNGKFQVNRFLDDLAASYGLGIRLNFDYFILRFDMAMKAVNPVYDTPKEHFPIIHPDFGRDFAFHFAVGMPF
ncbi:MAG: BamA/TamA family outer membrane protein [Prevotella sp.]|nr:BamA/TamA family outer membrane protein [Candidatus Equicola stercoris]